MDQKSKFLRSCLKGSRKLDLKFTKFFDRKFFRHLEKVETFFILKIIGHKISKYCLISSHNELSYHKKKTNDQFLKRRESSGLKRPKASRLTFFDNKKMLFSNHFHGKNSCYWPVTFEKLEITFYSKISISGILDTNYRKYINITICNRE